MAILEVKKLNKTFPGGLFEKPRHVLKDVTFALPEGETTGFVGSNGSGKTTSIKCMLEFMRPESGQILFFGKPLDLESKKRIGYLPERPYLYEFLTGMEFLKLHWNLVQVDEKDFIARAHEALKRVDLFEARDKKLRHYSKGMLQRVGIAQAIINKPDLLILDEPMSGLDPDGRGLVKDILREESKRGTSLFFSSHLLQDMEELCSHLVVINKGAVLYDGQLIAFMKQYKSLEDAFRFAKEQGGLA
ncbi:MAG: ABC transporter ATP-binding protein [Proteobacteria bacterium]|nr:MAG: ABC transporter ATP-binding protein [Pseudomonadota bacterium]